MILNIENAEALALISREAGWSKLCDVSFTSSSLAGLAELARVATSSGISNARNCARNCIHNLPLAQELFDEICAMLDGQFKQNRSIAWIHSSPSIELWMLNGSDSLEDSYFDLYLQRFHRSLSQAGFGSKYPYLLHRALLEMADNIVRHSSSGNGAGCGVIGFHVTNLQMNYFAIDLGRGVLASLRGNPKWDHLSDEGDALVKAVNYGATSSTLHDQGDGFRTAFQAFLDREGVFVMNSGSATARITGNLAKRETDISYVAKSKGFRLAAFCNLSGPAQEIEISA